MAVVLLPANGAEGMIPARDIPMDAALVYGCAADYPAVDWLVRRKLPLVFVDGDPRPGAASVILDEREGARLAAQHLLDLGHRRVATFTMNVEVPPGWAPDITTAASGFVARERQLGWVETLTAGGVTPVTYEVRRQHGAAHLRGRPRDARRRHAAHGRPVLLRPDGRGRRARRRAARPARPGGPVGDRVRRRAAGPPLRPTLTTVRQDFEAKGKAAAGALTRSIARDRAGEAPDAAQHMIPVTLVVRDSTAPPPDA